MDNIYNVTIQRPRYTTDVLVIDNYLSDHHYAISPTDIDGCISWCNTHLHCEWSSNVYWTFTTSNKSYITYIIMRWGHYDAYNFYI